MRVSCIISSGVIANIFLHSDMGMSDGTFYLTFDVKMMFTKYISVLVSLSQISLTLQGPNQ